jgi:ubiquinol oxidase
VAHSDHRRSRAPPSIEIRSLCATFVVNPQNATTGRLPARRWRAYLLRMMHQATAPADILARRRPHGLSDHIAFALTKALRFFADAFFAKRYGHRAVVLETVAAVPGIVGGMMNHLKSLRRMRDDEGWIRTLLEEAENERMHLMTFVTIARPNWFERLLVLLAQGAFFNAYFILYLFAPRTAHRMVGFFEEEAVVSYTEYLAEIESGRIENIAAPKIAIDYWKLGRDARLSDVVRAVRADEAGHRDVNHRFADALTPGVTAIGAAASSASAH